MRQVLGCILTHWTALEGVAGTRPDRGKHMSHNSGRGWAAAATEPVAALELRMRELLNIGSRHLQPSMNS